MNRSDLTASGLAGIESARSLLRATGARLRPLAPSRATLRDDAVAGVPGAISSVPDGMACAVLVGANPIHGLYAGIFGPIAGGLSASTRLMVITTTTVAALAAGSALERVDPADRAGAVFLLTILAGAISLLLQLRQEAIDLSVVQLTRLDDARFAERPGPARPASAGVTLLDVYGSLYYAGARTLEAGLPDPTGTTRPVVIVRLRGRTASARPPSWCSSATPSGSRPPADGRT